ncbi:MAG: ATP-binding protein [Bdellovibrionales bacterium]|nr:ATP-binding protein [Bdellovibrionales bacterium]
MVKTIELPFVSQLRENLAKPRPLIQVVLGPRQVGKTTGVHALLSSYSGTYHYVSADGPISKDPSWIFQEWILAESKGPSTLLVIDEIQKVEKWSESIKDLWDKQATRAEQIKVILLGSSSLSIQRGLTESLAGRFYLHKVWHWSPKESSLAYNISLNDYIIFGGYPASYAYIENIPEWLEYVRESIINSVIGRDILSLVRVKSPALFRQCFDLVCSYPAQEVSYNKLLGQLQDRGNTDLIKNYLEHFEGAFLIKQLYKYSSSGFSSKGSSPKLLPLCPALYSVNRDGHLSDEEKGRSFELMIGALLLRKPGQLFYWRNKDAEVDYVYRYQQNLIAIEVKSGRVRNTKGLHEFSKIFKDATPKIVTKENYEKILDSI